MQGEALSSLCYVARVSLVTRCRTADFGTRLIFDNKGKQLARDATAREVQKPSVFAAMQGGSNKQGQLCMCYC